MEMLISRNDIQHFGLSDRASDLLVDEINAALQGSPTARDAWLTLCKGLLWFDYPFSVHLFVYNLLFPNWRSEPELAPAYIPTIETVVNANITHQMSALGITDVAKFHHYSVTQYEDFWQTVTERLGIVFKKPWEKVCDLEAGLEAPQWFKGSELNIVDSCFQALPDTKAIIYQDRNGALAWLTYSELNQYTNRIANSLRAQGMVAGDRIGIIMPMTQHAIGIYLGILKIGATVVSIPDSFSLEEIESRLAIAPCKLIFTQNTITWGSKQLPLYEKLKTSTLPPMVVYYDLEQPLPLRTKDLIWHQFLVPDIHCESHACHPHTPSNILFSSGTTAAPKAIPWDHTTPIKCASDAFYHHNIKPGDVLAWPTNLGWMMGPWLLFAALINQATLALYVDVPKDRAFGKFIEQAGVTMLGVVPTLVATWRQSQCMEGLDWQKIKVFSSTGECSNPEDMLYLMSLARYKPVIEYCGGTEIGGGYLTSTVVQDNFPSLFSTKAMGTDFVILDEDGRQAQEGEVALIPPALGLSNTLLNANHHDIYYANMPPFEHKILRRHGDLIARLPHGYFIVLGRADDSMNLGGIKISAAAIERSLAGIEGIADVAAIAIAPHHHGPSQLIIYAVTNMKIDKTKVLRNMQKQINERLNPLFKIADVVYVDHLPRTVSNKVMRRVLRKAYEGYVENHE